MSNLIAAAVLGSMLGAAFGVLVIRLRLQSYRNAALAAVVVLAFILVMEVAVTGNAQRVMHTGFLSCALVAGVVNLASKHPGRQPSGTWH